MVNKPAREGIFAGEIWDKVCAMLLLASMLAEAGYSRIV
jgi:hypothetical protein